MNVELPDGQIIEDVPEGTTKAQLVAKLARNGYDTTSLLPQASYSNEGRSRPTERNAAADEGVAGRYWEGVKGGASRMRDAMFPPGNPVHALSMGTVGTDNVPARKASLAHYERTKDQLGFAGAAGDLTPEVLASVVPVARASTALAKVPVLAKTMGRYAPAAADIGVSMAYEGGKTALTGGSGEDIAQDALIGGAGATAGRVLTRALGGAKPLISQSARELVDQGVVPTPGQLFGDGFVGRAASAMEDRFAGYPVTGDVIGYARRRAVKDYNRAETNTALSAFDNVLTNKKPEFDAARRAIGSPRVSATGAESIDAAQKKISAAFTTALDGMDLGAKHIDNAIGATRHQIDNIPLLDEGQIAKLNHYINLRVEPHLADGGIAGEAAKAIDAEMGHYARQFSRSMNPADRPLGEAFYALQQNWRAQMANAADDAGKPHLTALLNAANEAHKRLLPLVRASNKASAQGGVFTPNQLQRSYGPYNQKQSALNRAAQEVLPSRVPDSGTAGRLLLGALVGGGAAIPGSAATAAALGSILYTRPGMHMFLNGMGGLLPQASRDYLSKLRPDALVKEIARMHAKYPHLREGIENTLRSMPAQGGRESLMELEDRQ